ncbi:hypothetical protein QOT17_024506 [Balamuthia mandrillaris]
MPDLYFYSVLQKNGKAVLIQYKSAECMGLAPAGKDLEAKGFWVSAVAELDAGAFKCVGKKRVPSCPLTNHPTWRQPNGDVLIKNFNGGLEDLIKLAEPFGCADTFGLHSGGEGQPSEVSVSFANVEEAQRAIAALNEVHFNGVKMTVTSKNASQGPEMISHYDYPHSFFEPFIEEVEEVNVDYENDEETEEYLNTSATYQVTFKDPSFCEHLHVGLSWWGR